MTPPFDLPAPAADELLGEDWFGEGSVFDSGEDLATALAGLASGALVWPVAALNLPGVPVAAPGPSEHTLPSQGISWASDGPAVPPQPADEFQVATMPSARGEPPTGWALRSPAPLSRQRRLGGGPAPDRSGWSIRQSVQMLRMTEDTLYRLREEAAQLTWQLAALTHREIDA